VPPFPSNHRSLTLLVGLLLAGVISLGMAWGSEYLDPTFRTPDEVKAFLNVSVLAALPKNDNENTDIHVS
jgi:capsular polysaccharide biosynthesis protein